MLAAMGNDPCEVFASQFWAEADSTAEAEAGDMGTD